MSLASGVSALATRIADEVNTLRGEITTALAGYVPTSRTISPGTGLTGGGDLSADRTLTVAYGTSSSTAAVGNDARLSDTRTPTDGTVTNAKVDAAAAIDESKLALASDAVAGTASRRTLGTGATQAAAGNDSRLSDTRTPTALSVTDASVSATAAIAETKLSLASDAVAGTASRRTLGTGATQAAAGNHAHAAADVTSGTLAIARIPTGTSSSTVCIGNDARLSDTRTPSALSVVDSMVSTSAAIAESKLSLASDAAAGTASRRTLGTGATQAAAGNDSRLSDTRTPSALSVTNAMVSATAAIAESKLALASDAAAGTASRRTLGTGSTQAAAGNDSRLSDARTPTAHASSHASGGSDPISPASLGAPAFVGRGRRTTMGTTVTAAFSATRALSVSASVVTGHIYQVDCLSAGIVGPNIAATNPSGTTVTVTVPCFVAQLVYTTNGTEPLTTSPVLAQCSGITVDGVTIWNPLSGFFVAAATGTLRVTLTYQGTLASASPGYHLYADATFPTDILIQDLGTNTGTLSTIVY